MQLLSTQISPKRALFASTLVASLALVAAAEEPPSVSPAATPALGMWRAWLETPGGELPFALELAREGTTWGAFVANGAERLAVPQVELVLIEGAPARLALAFPHYDSRIDAEVSADGRALAGTWRKRRGASEVQELRFHARAGAAPRFTADLLHAPPRDAEPARLAKEKRAAIERARGRFAVRFASSADPAVALFEVDDDGLARGTFLTTTGDYRYLAGQLDRAFAGDDGLVGCVDDGLDHHFLRLSCFDGAHAFLFSAEMRADGTLEGGFWSGAQHYEAWTARRDAGAALPDELGLSRVVEGFSLAELAFPQVFPVSSDERAASYPLRSLGDPAFAGRARLVQIFGSWCPNCHDACALLAELHQRYGPRGLAIQGLAFELGNDLARDAVQVQRYAARHGITWPLLLAGPADKQGATAALRVLDRVRAYPTTLFLDREGRVRHVLTGFSGPATGAEHARQRARIERLIEELLAG